MGVSSCKMGVGLYKIRRGSRALFTLTYVPDHTTNSCDEMTNSHCKRGSFPGRREKGKGLG